MGNKDLKWEKTTTTNVGLDISLFNSRVNLALDWYNNESSNLLIKNKIPTTTGYADQYQNLGSIRNRGFEIVLNTTNIRTKDFTWSTDLILLSIALKYWNYMEMRVWIILYKTMSRAWGIRLR